MIVLSVVHPGVKDGSLKTEARKLNELTLAETEKEEEKKKKILTLIQIKATING
jgi:hypothetical protein